ncbi:MAG: glycosyltransferase family 4 protein [Pirellulaceae bacterium]
MNRAPRKTRILMLLENAGIPEDHRVVREAEALLGIGCDVTIICPTCGRQPWSEVVRGIQVYRFPQSFSPRGFLGYVWEYGYSIAMFFLLASYVWCRQGFDVIHVHTPPDLTATVAIFFQQFGKKFVFDHHDLSPELYLARRDSVTPNLVYRVLRYFERLACRQASRLIATNTTQRNVQIQRCGAKPEHCYVVRNGPNEAFLKEVKPWPELRFPGKIVLGYVGIIGVQDGVDYMIRVVQELKYQHRRDDFLAVIVGHGPALADLKVLARTLRVEQQVLFTGRVAFADVPRYIAAFDICLTPDPSNAYNDSCTTIKTLEYMALGKPTVCFRTAENEITAGEAALYADHNNVSAYANLVVRLMDNPGLRADMGALARRRIDAGLTWERQAVQLVELYRDLLRLC